MNKSDSSSRDSGVLSSPLSFLRNGNLSWGNTDILNLGSYGYYWLLRSINVNISSSFVFGITILYPQYNVTDRGTGMAARCVSNPMVWWSRSRFYMSKRLAIT